MADNSQKSGDDIRIIAEVKDGGRTGDIVGKKYETRPTVAREMCELREWQGKHLEVSVPAYSKRQHRLRELLADPPSPGAPYKGLNYFNPLDTSIFFGRDAVVDELVTHLLRPDSRLTVLHGPSGAGKTSLIRAALIPRLLAEGCYTVWATPLPYPANIYEPIVSATPGGPDYDDLPLYDFLNWTTSFLGHPSAARLVVFIDQFERIFEPELSISLDQLEGDLVDCVEATDDVMLPVRLIISIRTDFVGMLDQFRRSLPGVLDCRKMLPGLTDEQALEAIMRPVEGRAIGWERDAAQAVLDYLAKDEIALPHLQLICTQLYEQAEQAGDSIIRLAEVEDHDLKKLHREYLKTEVANLPDEELGWAILKQLVTSQGVARPLLLSEIEQVVAGDVRAIVDTLVDRRVLRRESRRDDKLIEIAHETLAQEILAHASQAEIRAKAAWELFSRGLDDWLSLETKPLLSVDRLRVLDEYRQDLASYLSRIEELPEKRQKALEFLFRSALAAVHEVAYWLDRAQASQVHVETILQERLESENFHERVAAIDCLSSLTGEKHLELFIRALADEYPQVRVAAIRTLERLRSDDEWRKSLTYECYVPAGKFTIGDDQGNSAAEPMNEIYLDSFYIGRYPVTNADFKRYSEDKGRSFEIPEGKADHPVIGVSWDDARDYVAWAGMRLLTEEEWEKAASWQEQGSGWTGGKKRRYPWGDEFDESKCNTFESGNDDTTPVGNYSPEGDSPYGVADMAGNVWEWTSSLYQGSPHWTDSEHEEISSFDGLRVMRGGSFYSYHTSACTSFRWRDTPESVMEAVGIRVGFTSKK